MFNIILQMMLKIPCLQNIRILFFFYDSFFLKLLRKPEKKNDKKYILIVFPLSLGDAIMMRGVIEQLKGVFSTEKYCLHILCHEAYEGLFKPYFDEVISVDMRKASVSPVYRISFLKQCRKYYYDIIFDPTGTEECTPGVYAVNAAVGRKKVGVLSRRDKKYQLPEGLRKKIFDTIIWKEEKTIHRVRYYAEVFSEAFNNKFMMRKAKIDLGNAMDLPLKYIVVFPSASTMIKRWPVEYFAEITELLVNEMKCPVVICGTKQDYEVTLQFKHMLSKKIQVVDYLLKTSVEELIEMIGRAEFVFTNDTSVYHIAVAANRKTCCVTGDYVYKSFMDYCSEGLASKENVSVVSPGWECKNCENHCSKRVDKTYPCVLENTVMKVWEEIRKLLRNSSNTDL